MGLSFAPVLAISFSYLITDWNIGKFQAIAVVLSLLTIFLLNQRQQIAKKWAALTKRGSTKAQSELAQVPEIAEIKDDSSVGFVLNHSIAQKDLDRFWQLQKELDGTCSGFEGFLSAEIKNVSTDTTEDSIYSKFQTLLVFKSVSDLARWIDSPQRRKLLDTIGKDLDYRYTFVPPSSGFSSWFQGQNKDSVNSEIPAIWKQNLLVLLGIYPQLLIQQILLVPALIKLDFPTSLLVATIVAVHILSWLWMPILNILFQSWLNKDRERPVLVNVIGTTIVVLLILSFLKIAQWGDLH